MTIHELHIQLDLQPENRIDILKDVAEYCSKGYLFVDLSNSHCYLFDEDGNEDDVKKLIKIDDEIFFDSNIESIVIPDSVKSIGYEAFYYCESLESIIIPDSVKLIGYYAFENCINLKSIVISNSVKSIGKHAFRFCENMKSLSFKGKTMKQVKAMENYPFGIIDKSIIKCIYIS